METHVHCNLSRCERQPGYCEEAVRPEDHWKLVMLVFVPICIALFAPRLSVVSERVWRRDDDIPSTIHKYSGIDPPMFLCGVGLLPLDCGLSGLLTVVSAMAFGFVVIFFSLLYSPQPCTTALGACRTISCACGNLITEGYVFMFCLLIITSTILVQKISAMPQHHRVQHRMIKPTLILGALLLTLTGIFPERYDANGTMDAALYLLYCLHLLGVFGSGLLLLGVPYAWFFEHWLTHRTEVPLRSLLARTAYFIATFLFGCFFVALASDNTIVDETPRICESIDNQSECDGWPLLTPSMCDTAIGCATAPELNPQLCDAGNVMLPNFQCKWRPNNQLSNWTRSVFPTAYVESASCVRINCPLNEYARGVALEFGVLLLTLCYVSSFALHDVRRLLDRPPPEARLGAAAEGVESGRQPLQISMPASSDGGS